jgi:hypothetical protein
MFLHYTTFAIIFQECNKDIGMEMVMKETEDAFALENFCRHISGM